MHSLYLQEIYDLKNTALYCRLAKLSIKENIIVKNEATIPRVIVLKIRLSNSEFNPLCIWSIFKKNQKHGIPIEKIGGNKEIIIAKNTMFLTPILENLEMLDYRSNV